MVFLARRLLGIAVTLAAVPEATANIVHRNAFQKPLSSVPAAALGASGKSQPNQQVLRVALKFGPPLRNGGLLPRPGNASSHRSERRRSFMQVRSASKADAEPPAIAPPSPLAVYGIVYVGTPAQELRVAFDTGSGNLVLPTKSCTSVSCLTHKRYDGTLSSTSKEIFSTTQADFPPAAGNRETVPLNIGVGSLQGPLKRDKVCLGPQEALCAFTTFVGAATMSDQPFGLLPYDGILGLGLPGSSVDRSLNLFGNLVEEGVVERSRFAVWLSKEGDADDSEVTFGGINENRLGSKLLWMPVSQRGIAVVSAGATGMWQISFSDVLVDGASIGVCTAPTGGVCMEAALDSGTGVLAGPTAMIEGILTVLDVKEDCGNYAELPTLGIKFGIDVLNLEPSDYVRKDEGRCYPQLMGLDLPPPKGPMVLLGTPFLRRYYTVYDRETLRVGFAFANHIVPSDKEGETIEEAAARLMVQPDESAETDANDTATT